MMILHAANVQKLHIAKEDKLNALTVMISKHQINAKLHVRVP